MLSKLPPLRNGQPTADWCMAVAEFLDALQTTTGGGGFRSGVTIDQTGMSFQEYDKSAFLATITGRSGSAYAWTKLVSSTGGVNGTDGYGASGTTSLLPAYHVTGATSIANGSVVLMWPADSENEMRFVNGLDPSNLIDLSGRSGSLADVTALQILRGVISGTASAAVFTPDLASTTLPGIISSGGGTQTIDVSLGIKPNGGISFDPANTTGHGADGHIIGVSTDFPDWICVWRNLGLPSSDAPDGYLRAYQLRADSEFNHNGTNGASGTDVIGNVFGGGIATTVGGSNLSVPGSVAFTGDISPSQLVADTDDWSPTGWN